MKVMKFGGASLGDGAKIKLVSKIIRDYISREKIVVVISAVLGVTDKLIIIDNHYKSGNISRALAEVKNLYFFHLKILSELNLSSNKYREGESQINSLFGALFSQLILKAEREKGWLDNFLSFGERLSARLVTYSLIQKRIRAKYIDSRHLIITDRNFGFARPFYDKTIESVEKFLYPLLVDKFTPIVTGFYGSTTDGKTAILGRGGSDYSATILAFALDAQEVILWKEVNGIYDSDPKKSQKARFFSEISYRKALRLACSGAKILHPQALKPVAEKEIVVWIKNTFNPAQPGSKIWKGNGHDK